MEQRVNPCRKDCPKRAADCHVWCEKYRDFRAWKEEEYAEGPPVQRCRKRT